MKYKRKKPRRQVKCNLCTDNRLGNGGHTLHRRIADINFKEMLSQ